jgi:hypothetical protein
MNYKFRFVSRDLNAMRQIIARAIYVINLVKDEAFRSSEIEEP